MQGGAWLPTHDHAKRWLSRIALPNLNRHGRPMIDAVETWSMSPTNSTKKTGDPRGSPVSKPVLLIISSQYYQDLTAWQGLVQLVPS